MRKAYIGSTTAFPTLGVTLYNPPCMCGASVWGSSSALATQIVIPFACRISNFKVDVNTAPGAGEQIAFNLRKNDATDILSATISGTSTQANDDSSVVLAAGDKISTKALTSAAATNYGNLRIAFNIETYNKRYAIFTVKNGTTGTDGVRQYGSIDSGRTISLFTTTNSQMVWHYMSHSGTIKSMNILQSAAPGAGKSFTWSIYKNGVEEASSITTISGAAQVTATTALNISFNAGDYIYYSVIASGTPTTHRPSLTLEIEPTVDGESNIECTVSGISVSATHYNRVVYPGAASAGTTESTSNLIVPKYGFSLRNFNVVQSAAPGGAGKQVTYSWRKNSGASNNSLVISNASTSGSDLVNVTSYVENDTLTVQSVPSGTPAATNINAYATMFCPPTYPNSRII